MSGCIGVASTSKCMRAVKTPRLPCYVGAFLMPVGSRMSLRMGGMGGRLLGRNVLLCPIRPPMSMNRRSLR